LNIAWPEFANVMKSLAVLYAFRIPLLRCSKLVESKK
jgi:hypothetical protein